MIPFLLTLTVGGGHLPACAAYDVTLDRGARVALSRQVRAATHQVTSPSDVTAAIGSNNWRIVWANPRGSEPGVFLFRIAHGRFHYVNVWGGVATEDERREVVAWATRQNVPATLARCFAGKLLDDGP
jgi:hypothetical protein